MFSSSQDSFENSGIHVKTVGKSSVSPKQRSMFSGEREHELFGVEEDFDEENQVISARDL